MKGKVVIIISALILAVGTFILMGKTSVSSAFAQKKTDITPAAQTSVQNETENITPSSAPVTPVQVKKDETKDDFKPVKITAKNIKSSDEYIDIDIKIPVISGMKDTDIQKNINTRLEKEAVSFKEETEKNAHEDMKNAKDQGMEFRKFGAYSQYTLSYNKNGYLSLVVDYYSYTGGAHGMTNKVAYNYDLKTGKEIALADIFKKEFSYKKYMNKEITSQMKNSKDIFFYDDGGFKTIADKQPYYISDGNIVIYFQLYEIAPYAAGFPEFRIPFSSVQDNMKIEF